MARPLLGSHVGRADPLGSAARRRAEVVQVHLSPPLQWRGPVPHGDEDTLASAGLPLFVHAPYLLNPASIRPELRRRTVTALRDQLVAAARVGAAGLVVHGGHPTGGGSLDAGVAGWLEVLAEVDLSRCRLLIENTAGGEHAPARTLEALRCLFARIRDAGWGPERVGFVLDTCHAHAGGLDPGGLVPSLVEATGGIDLVHLNDSSDPAGSGRDHHRNLGTGVIDPAVLVEVAATAGAPVVVETPGGAAEQAADLAWLRTRLE